MRIEATVIVLTHAADTSAFPVLVPARLDTVMVVPCTQIERPTTMHYQRSIYYALHRSFLVLYSTSMLLIHT